MVNHHTTQFTLTLLVLSTALLGISTLLIGHHGHIQLTTDFFGISNLIPAWISNGIAGLAFLLIGILSVRVLVSKQQTRLLAVCVVFVSAIPLLTLLSPTMWIADLGGFPAIGSGQGVIKYFALLSIGLMLWLPPLNANIKKALALFPVVLVLLWIGGMKFTLLEAKGIEPLVQSSPLMSWMYQLWDLQTTSNLIGVYDLIAVILLLISLRVKVLVLPAIAISGAVFLVTQTFLFTWNSALSGETVLSTGGHFLIKDLWYLCNLGWYWQLQKAQ